MINPPRHQTFKPFVDYVLGMNADVHPRIKASYCRNLIHRLGQSELLTHVDLLSRFHFSAWLEEQTKNAEDGRILMSDEPPLDVPDDDFPKPKRQDGKEPCGECHLLVGEVCDICGAVQPVQ